MSTTALETLISSVRSWPSDDLAELLEVARVIEARRKGVYRMNSGERAAVTEALAQARQGDFVADEDMEAVWARLGA